LVRLIRQFPASRLISLWTLCASLVAASWVAVFGRIFLSTKRICTAQEKPQLEYAAAVAAFSEVSTGAATATVFLIYLYS
jgi:hypothetical protein